jgi:Right handed beta helix region
MRLDNIDCHGVTESHCIYVNWNDSIIENSFFHHNTNHGIHWRKSSGDQGKCQPDCGTRRNIIRNTKIYNNRTGLNWAYGGENQFYNNLVYNHEHFGLNVGGIHGPNKFWNNTIWNNATGGQSSHGGLRLQACAEVKNNIVFGNGSQQIFGDVSCSTLSNNITAQNPLFVNQNAGDFHLKSGSPAINAGVNLSCCVPDDFDHADRLVGGTYDIGAYEFGGTAPTPGPGDTTPPSVPTGLTVQRDSDT